VSDAGARQPRRRIPVGLSTSSAFPGPAALAFALAAELGYDGVEIMVTAERVTQDGDRLAELVQQYQVPVLSVHSPCLLVTARVWGTDPLVKIARSVELAERVGAGVVVAPPPFVWQRAAAGSFVAAVDELSERTDVSIASENMLPLRVAGASVNSDRPHWDPVPAGYQWFTLDLSHTAASGVNAREMVGRMGDRLAHVHLADGSGAARDEHLVPGRGVVPCGEVLAGLAAAGFAGSVVVEVTTRGLSPDQRETDLAEALTFARWHLDEPPPSRGSTSPGEDQLLAEPGKTGGDPGS
jgi:sugar phosphate isomerase/epimerase